MKRILNYIDGNFCEPISGSWLDNIAPATGKVYSQIPDSDAEDVENAYQAAAKAFPVW